MMDWFASLDSQYQHIKQALTCLELKPHQWFFNSDLFNTSCFYTQSDELQSYLDEVEQNLKRIRQIKDPERLSHLTERLTDQFSCLKNFLNSQDINKRSKDYRSQHMQQLNRVKQLAQRVTRSSRELYQELAELQQFERRLLDMVSIKQQALTANTDVKARISLQTDVLHTQQRLGRCRQAISKVEEQIQRSERGA